MADTALQRRNMVESQVRPSDVTDRRITAAMAALPREQFVPEALADLAYIDTALQIGDGREMLAPRDIAKLIQLADVNSTDRVLTVGSAYGYGAAILSRIAKDVVALETDVAMAATSRVALADVGATNVSVVTGPLSAGWSEGAPYDVIVVEGGIAAAPDALTMQLATGGRLVAILVTAGVSRAVIIRRDAGRPSAPWAAFDAAAVRLPGFSAGGPAFTF